MATDLQTSHAVACVSRRTGEGEGAGGYGWLHGCPRPELTFDSIRDGGRRHGLHGLHANMPQKIGFAVMSSREERMGCDSEQFEM